MGPLLETKLHVPRWRRGLVARPRLSERLSRGAQSALTLVSAPAGFGKTTLLAEWLTAAPAAGRSVAWLSLDQRDNDPVSFWTYLVAALKAAAPAGGAGALSLLQPPQPPGEAGLATLLNDLDAVSDDVVLVLDDYHVIDARDVQDGMAFLLEHLPPQIHLVIGSRADPALPLARMRGRGELVEIRAADLRFTPAEAATYLNEVMGLALTAADVAALEGRTEGWIAALQLAALSMQGREDTAAFIAGFAGDDRYIVDYLAEEVLQRQPEDVRQFLLQTSILDRLNGPLCDAATGRDDGRAMLAALERGNLFLVPLDDRRRWYRYHQLFADVLQAHLQDEQPDEVPDLHRRASGWYERNGEPGEAIRHALAAGDHERAADLVELAIPAMRRSRQEGAVRGWLELLPAEVVRVRPVLSVGFAGALLAHGELEGASRRRSRCTVPPRPWLGAMGPAPCGTPGGRTTFRGLTTTSAVLWPPAFCGAITNVMVFPNLAAAATAHTTPAAAAQFLVTTFTSGFGQAFQYAYFLGIYVAPLLMGIALWRSRAVPRWLAVLFFAGLEVAQQQISSGPVVVLYMLPFAAAMVLLAARIWPAAALPASQPHLEPAGLPV